MKKFLSFLFFFAILSFTEEKPAILFLQSGVDRKIGEKLVNSGMEIDEKWSGFPDNEILKKYNVVVLLKGGAYLKEKEIENLLKYVEEGGGLFICLWKGEQLEDFKSQFLLLDRLNAKLRPEGIHDKLRERDGETPWGIKFAYTKKIKKIELTENVNCIWYPVSEGAGGMSSTLPFEVGNEWEVIVSGEDTSITTFWSDASRGLEKERIPEKPLSSPPIFAIRNYGNGRIALFGINSSYHFFGGYARALKGIVIEEGLNGEKSDLLNLLINSLKWLSEPSLKNKRFGGGKTPEKFFEVGKLPNISKVNWEKVNFPSYPKIFKGIVGIQTDISGGKNKIEEFVKIAKEEKIDFIVFLEDLKNLSKEDWEGLVKKCREISDDKFLAVPGFKFKDVYGNNYFACGYKIRYPDDYLLDENRNFVDRLPKSKNQGQVAEVLLDWMHNLNRMNLTIGSYLHSQNPCPYYDFRAYDSVAIITQDFRKNKPEIVDEIINGYLHLQNRGESLWPFAITLIDQPEQMKNVIKEGYLNYFEASSLNDLNEHFARWHPSVSGYNPLRYISNGPKIIQWCFIGSRDYENYEWFDWTRWKWKFKLVAESDIGLKEVLIYDGNDLIRHFYLNGEKSFVWEEDMTHGQQHNILVIVKDLKDRQAISNEYFDRPQPLLEEFMCGDRMNQLSYSMQKKPDGKGLHTGFVYGMTPNKGPWASAGNIAPASTFKPDDELGGMIPGFDGAPSGDPSLNIVPYIKCDKGEENIGQTKIYTDRLLHTADIMMGYGKTDGFYINNIPALNVWHTLAPTIPTKIIDVKITHTYFNLRPGLLSSQIADISIKFKQDVKVEKLKLGTFYRGRAKKWIIRKLDGEILSGDKESPPQMDLLNDAYAAFVGSPLGSVVLFNLSSQPLKIINWEIYLPFEGKEIKKDEEINLKILAIGAPFTFEINENWIEKIRTTMGFSGNVSYKLKIEKGELIDKRYILNIDGKKEGFKGRFEKEDLILTLPVIVSNLNKNWSVFLAENDKERARPIGQIDGFAYATIDLREEPGEIFIGHPVLADEENIIINVVQTGERSFSIYVHNPEKKEKRINLRSASGWKFGNIEIKNISLKPGEIKKFEMNF